MKSCHEDLSTPKASSGLLPFWKPYKFFSLTSLTTEVERTNGCCRIPFQSPVSLGLSCESVQNRNFSLQLQQVPWSPTGRLGCLMGSSGQSFIYKGQLPMRIKCLFNLLLKAHAPCPPHIFQLLAYSIYPILWPKSHFFKLTFSDQ